MSKKISFVVALAAICALSLFLLNCGSSSSRPSGLLYVVTQGINSQGVITGLGNNVSSFSIDDNNGNLTLINYNASTCPTQATESNPEPCGIPLQILLDPTDKVAFVLDQGGIFAFTVNSDGSLSAPMPALPPSAPALPGTPIAMTRDAAGQFLFVINEGSGPSATNCQYLPPSYPNIQCASISVFAMQPGSTSLTEAPGSPYAVGRIPSALSVITYPGPTSTMEVLYVTFNVDPALHNDSTLSAYSVDSSGTLADLRPDSPYVTATDPISVLAVNTTPAGESTGGVFVYVGSQANQSGALSVFQVCPAGNSGCQANQLVAVGTPTSLGQNPVAMLVDPTNSFLYVVCYVSSQIYGYRINTTTGALVSQSPPSQPTGSQPVSMAMHPSVSDTGEFLYTSNSGQSNITGFAVSTTTGSMSSLPPVIAPAAPSGMTAD
jgi:hypothetical protein